MTTASTEIGTLLVELLAGASARVGGESGDIHTLDVLHRLSSRRAEPLEPGDRTALEMLCRKLGVAGRVWEAYDSAWKRPASRAPLTAPGYALLAAVLIDYASTQGHFDSDPGAALKYLNAAFGALDLAREGGGAEFPSELDAVADRVLGQLLPGL